MRARVRCRVMGESGGRKRSVACWRETSRAPQPFLGVSVNSLSTVICSFLELVHMDNLFLACA